MQLDWSVAARRLNSLDAIDSDANRDDIELLARFQINEALGDHQFGVCGRASGTGGNETAYEMMTYETTSQQLQIRMLRIEAGAGTTIATSVSKGAYVAGDWFYMRFRINGSDLKGKLWPAGEEEPAAWDLEETDSNITGVGWGGLWGFRNSGDSECDMLTIGTNGDAAPLAADTTDTVRISAAYAAVLSTNPNAPVRISAAYASVLSTNPTAPVRISAAYAAVLYRAPTVVDSDHVIPISWVGPMFSDTVLPAPDGLTISTPLLLYTVADLLAMDMSKHYALANDIDVNSENWTPLGAVDTPFTGSLDGCGFKIFNLHSTYNASHFGLFYELNTSTIRRLGVATTAAGITGQSSGLYSGVLVAIANQDTSDNWLVEDCWVEGKVDTGGDRCGGLIGITDSTIAGTRVLRRNRVAVELSGTIGIRVGGVTGFSTGTDITHSDNYFDSDVATTTSQGQGSVGTAKTTTLMQEEATFNNFDFDGVWFIDEGVTYPFLDEIHKGIPIAWQQGLAIDHIIPVEWTLETAGVESDHIIPIAWRQGLAIDRIIPVEWTGPFIEVDQVIPVEWKTELLLDHQIPVDWNTEIVPGDHQIPVEYGQNPGADSVIPIAWRQGLNSDQQIPVEWTGPALSIDYQILFSWINVTTPGDHQIPIEYGQNPGADSIIPFAWRGPVDADKQMPINWSGEFSADSVIPTEWTLGLNIDRQIPVEWTLTTTPGDHQILLEWRGGIASDNQIPFAWKGEPQPTTGDIILFAWRGPFADPGVDYQIPVDWKLELEIDRAIPVEWKTEIVPADHQIPVEWLLENVLVSLHVIPINWAGFIDVDSSIPVEWTTELIIDRIIPYDWQLTIFLEIDRQMPVEWKLDVSRDEGIPVEWFLQLELDHQIPVAWSGEFSAVDFIIPYEWTLGVARDESIPVEWNVDVLPDFIIPIEWTVDVGDDNQIPVEWLSPAISSDHIIPITWFGPVEFDQVIPFEWLQESFVQLDSEIPIEWQQIFFKKFDQVIPWEARGILDETRTINIEWRADPGFDAVIPYEWTDPLFSLFVTRDREDCEFWLADCNTAGWEALRCASLWLADELPVEAQFAEESGGTWTARNEEIGGTWFAAERQSNWEAPCLPTVWISFPPDVWYADDCPAMWFAQEQPVRWTSESQGSRWIVLEPNPRLDLDC